MLHYEFDGAMVWSKHPIMVASQRTTEDENKLWNEVLTSQVRSSLWNASVDGDEAASAALVDWYQEHGIFEKKDEP